MRAVYDVRAFVGMCSFYRRFIPNFAKIAAPLTALTKDNPDRAPEQALNKSPGKWGRRVQSQSIREEWTEQHTAAMEEL